MKVKSITMNSKVDFLSKLPHGITENILGCLPLRDVVRTSILSREWRQKWLWCPEIVFDFWFDQMFLGDRKLEPLIYQILKHHKGLLLKFTLQVPNLRSSSNINEWLHLLPSDTLQKLTLHVSKGDRHKLTPHLFIFRHLRNLKLYNCVFDPPIGFEGFGKLENLDFQNCAFAPETFEKFVASCPAVERIRLINSTSFDCLELTGPNLKAFDFDGVFKSIYFKNCPVMADVKLYLSSKDCKNDNMFSFDLVRSLSSLPSLENLQLQAYALEDLVEYGAPNKLPIAMMKLKNLNLSDMYFQTVEEISCVICFIRSCPNLQSLKITAFTFDVVGSVVDFLRSQKRSEHMAHLKAIKMQLFSGIEPEMEFVKYLLASATTLEEMAITPHTGNITDGGESILNELKQYPRASPRAEIISSDTEQRKRFP